MTLYMHTGKLKCNLRVGTLTLICYPSKTDHHNIIVMMLKVCNTSKNPVTSFVSIQYMSIGKCSSNESVYMYVLVGVSNQ